MPGRVLLLALIALTLLAAACGDEASAPTHTPETSTAKPSALPSAIGFTSAPSPTVSVVSPAGSPPAEMPAFREFAEQIAVAIADKDPTFFTSRARLIQLTCEGDEQLGPCSGHASGEVITGIPGSAWRSDASALFTVDDYSDNLRSYFEGPVPGASDGFGDSDVRLYALAYSGGDAPYFSAITTGILDTYPSTGYPIGQNEREAHVFNFALEGSDWAFTGERAAGTFGVSADWLSGMCPQCYDYFELWQGPSDG